MNTTRLITAIMTLMVLFYSSLVSAEIYQWVDAKGETHFSDKPPKSAKSARSKAAKKSQPAKRKLQLAKRNTQASTSKPQAIRQTKVAKRMFKPTKKKSLVKRQVKAAKRKLQPKSQSVKRKVYRNKVAAKKAKPRKKPVSHSRQVVRTAKISRGKKTRQISRPITARTTSSNRKAVSQAMPATTSLTVNAPAATLLLTSLDKTFYDIEKIAVQTPDTERPQAKKVITNFNESLCRDNRRHLAVLQEEGFQYYYDDEGELRVAWGVEGFYRQKVRYLSASEAADKRKNIAFEIERYCDEPYNKALQVQARRDWIRSEYCDVSKVILADLEHPFMRTTEAEIKDQQEEVERYCFDYPAGKYHDNERYYPTALLVDRLQQQHFLYR